MAVLQDDSTDDEEKAKHLCWLFHLVGDLHQPMHTTALFTTERFQEGDRGGNETKITPGSNLHSFWDSRLGSNNLLPSTVGTRAVEAMTTYAAEAEKAALCLDVEHWLQETHQLAVDVAYSPAIMEGVAEQEDSGADFVPIAISDEYKTTAGSVSQRRVAEAGYRLAGLLPNGFRRARDTIGILLCLRKLHDL